MDSYYNRSLKERVLLEEIYSKVYKGNNHKYYHTDPYGNDHYDSVVMRFHKDTTYLLDTHLFEVKIRDEDYETVLLERSKFNNLISSSRRYDSAGVNIYYVSCHPSGTWVFKINPKDKYNWITQSHNVSTVEDKGKKSKSITYLDKSNAKFIPISSNDIHIKPVLNIKEIIKEQKKVYCLYDFLTK